jgi:pimeloyl-ACP methyl ester carboxylesterase
MPLDNYPRASYVVLDKAGHNLQIYQEKLFGGIVNEWIDRVMVEL